MKSFILSPLGRHSPAANLLPERMNSPSFPTSNLPPVLRRVTEATAATLNVPEILPASAALAVISAAMGKGLEVESGPGRRLRGNLFLLVSAPSGAGKSSVLQEMIEPMRDIEEFLQVCDPGPVADDAGNGEEVRFAGAPPFLVARPDASQRRAGGSRHRHQRVPRRLICENITGPALASLLVANGESTFNVSAEAGNLLDEAGRAASDLGLLLLKGYSGDPVVIDRLTRDSDHLESPCISVFWLCQPHRLDRFLSRERSLEDGLIARFLVAHSEARMTPLGDELPGEIPVGVKDAYGAVVNDLFRTYHSIRNGTRTVRVSPGGFEVLKEYHNQCTAQWDELARLRPCVARWPEQARRLALVLHAAEHGGRSHQQPLSEATARAAVDLAEWFRGQQLAIIGRGATSRLEPRAERLLSLIAASPGAEVKVRDLKNSHGFTDEEIEEIVALHSDRLKLQNLQNPKGGRPSLVVVLTREVGDDAATVTTAEAHL